MPFASRMRLRARRAPLACSRCGSEVPAIDDDALARWEIGFDLGEQPMAVVLCPDCQPVTAGFAA